jgi:hypothetical protein
MKYFQNSTYTEGTLILEQPPIVKYEDILSIYGEKIDYSYDKKDVYKLGENFYIINDEGNLVNVTGFQDEFKNEKIASIPSRTATKGREVRRPDKTWLVPYRKMPRM